MDVQRQIQYWVSGSREDFEAAQVLLEKGHYRHCLFFTHLALEKKIKAHVVYKTGKTPPRIHNLIRLAQIANLSLDKDISLIYRNLVFINWKAVILKRVKSM